MSQSQRCPRCQAVVNDAQVGGVCPTCRDGILMPMGGGGGGGTSAAPAGGSGARKGILLVVLAGLGFLAYRYGGVALDRMRHPSEAVSTYRSTHLGMSLTFPKGWRHTKGDDEAKPLDLGSMVGQPLTPEQKAVIGSGEMRSSLFYRGGKSDDGDSMAFIAVMNLTSPLLRQAVTSNMVEVAKNAAQGGVSGALGQGVDRANLDDCSAATVGVLSAGRCVGTAAIGSDERALVMYVWPWADGIGLVVFLARAGKPEAEAEAESILASVTKL